jgi:cytochrome subunit of sulfide dehydrogenase
VLPSPRNHLYRLALLLIAAIAAFVWIKDWFVPAGWDEQKWFRSGVLEELKQQPLVFSGNRTCTEGCHGKTRKDHRAIGYTLAAGVHMNLGCESCHGPLYQTGHDKLAPAQIPRDSGLCLRCHDAVAARPRTVGLFSDSLMAHQALDVKRNSNCIQCHDPHAPRKRTVTAARGQVDTTGISSVMALAEGACNSCHRPGVPFMPLIAGQPEPYLKAIMRQYRDGKRHSLVMGDLLKAYSNENIDALARYYANANWTSSGDNTHPDLVSAGAALHQRRCAGCHGPDGRRAVGLTPRLAGQTISYTLAQINGFLDPKTQLPDEVMRVIVSGLSSRDAEALAHFYAAEPLSARQEEDMEMVIDSCNSCHRPGFLDMPLIAGQPEQYLRVVMQQQRDGRRSSRVMADLLKNYSDQKIAALARHYASSRWIPAPEKTNAAWVKAGAALHQSGCAGCHGPDGRRADGMTPRLAGQPASFTESMLKSYKNPKTKQPGQVMRTAAAPLSADDMRALAHYYASNPESRTGSNAAEAAAPAALVDVSGIVASCDRCHVSSETDPLIDGQPEEYLKTVMLQFLDGTRDGPSMNKIMKKYDADQAASLARHYAQKKWRSAAGATKPELVNRGKALHDARCGTCHANGGRKAAGNMPRIAGQPVEFIESEIRRYQDPAVKLPDRFMRAAVQSLSPEEVSALANYYASQGN